MRVLRLVVAALVLAAGGAMLWQHLRYLDTRRSVVDDRQPILYSGAAFHVISFLRVAPGEDVLGALRALRAATEGVSGARWIYAGKVVLNGMSSAQLGEVDWSAAIVVQYPSQEAHHAAAAAEGHREAFARFAERYSHGFVRPRALNLLLPQFLLARRIVQLASVAPSHFPFVRAERLRQPELAARLEHLLAQRELGARAAVVVNLTRRGTPEQQASDRSYTWRMLGAMAEGGYGPMHLGRAVAVEGDHDFDSVAIVYYPGVEFFHEMVRSEFFQGVIRDKALGDAQASITAPVLSQL